MHVRLAFTKKRRKAPGFRHGEVQDKVWTQGVGGRDEAPSQGDCV